MSEITEVEDTNGNVSTYYANRATYVTSGGTPPLMSTILTDLKYVELLTFAASQAEQGVGYQIGVAQENIHNFVAITRDSEMCSLKKSDIYLNIIAEDEEQATFYNDWKSYSIGVLKGGPTGGSQC